MKFSYCAIDRGQTPHRILAREYQTSAHAQLRWWNLDATSGRSQAYKSWALSGEDVSYDADSGLLWSLTEDDGKRSVFAVRIADV